MGTLLSVNSKMQTNVAKPSLLISVLVKFPTIFDFDGFRIFSCNTSVMNLLSLPRIVRSKTNSANIKTELLGFL